MKLAVSPAQLENDRLLWEGVKKSDARAFEALFHTNYPFLYDYGIRLVSDQGMVEDAIQDVFAYIWRKRHQLGKVDSVRSYLLVSMRRKLSQTIEKRNKDTSADEAFIYFCEQDTISLEEQVIRNEQEELRKQTIQKVFNRIPARMREALYLKKLNGLSYKEIAQIMEINPQVARNYVTEAFRRAKKIFLLHNSETSKRREGKGDNSSPK